MDQRRQEEVVKQFKAGVYNTLVATSIGEEGLDIGEVDLIVCYDQKASPIRMLQRMGRTGRKRQGNILLLQMEGKEENDALQAKDAYEKMQDKISKGDEFNFHTDIARRIVPVEINPVVEMKHIEIPIENSQPELPVPRAGKRGKTKRPPKKFQMPDGVVTGFVTAARMNGESDDEGQSRTKKRKKAPVIDEPEPVAAVEEVFLNAKQERELQTYYQRIDDADDDREIAPPVLKLHPEQQRQACRTRYVSTHSRLTTSFVDMVNRMHLMDKSNARDLENRFKNNLHMSDLEAGLSADEVSDELAEDDEDEGFGHPAGITPKHSHRRVMDEVGEGASSSPPPTDPRMRFRSQAIDLGTQDTEGEDEFEDYQLDSELAGFIADDADPVDTFSSSLPSIKATVRHTKLFTSSQKDQEDSDDDDLPDISQLVRRKNPEPPGKTASKAMISDSEDEGSEEEVEIDARKPAKRRLVIDDSESE
ncbi:Helicase [Neofusicoccum parvum]|nr:Helicase [Neofusicoccum parvum]